MIIDKDGACRAAQSKVGWNRGKGRVGVEQGQSMTDGKDKMVCMSVGPRQSPEQGAK